LGYTSAFPSNPNSFSIIDDHIYFAALGIPTLDLIIDFRLSSSYHHTHSDNLSNIRAESLKMTGETIESFMYTYFTGTAPWDWGDGFNPFGNILYGVMLIAGGLLIGFGVIKVIKWLDMRKIQKEKLGSQK